MSWQNWEPENYTGWGEVIFEVLLETQETSIDLDQITSINRFNIH